MYKQAYLFDGDFLYRISVAAKDNTIIEIDTINIIEMLFSLLIDILLTVLTLDFPNVYVIDIIVTFSNTLIK